MNINTLKLALGDVIKGERLSRGMSLREMEKEHNINKSLLSRAENGKANLCLNSLNAIAWVFDMEACELMRRAESRARTLKSK